MRNEETMPFFQAYANAKIGATPLPQLEDYNNPSENKQDTNWSNTVATIQLPRFTLSWSHYLVLMRIENIEARSFYEIEAARQRWSVKQLACDGEKGGGVTRVKKYYGIVQ